MSERRPQAPHPDAISRLARREFMRQAGAGTVVAALGGLWAVASDELIRQARAEDRPDGRPRLPPGQKTIEKLKPMGGTEGDPSRGRYRLTIHGEVDKPLTLDFRALLDLPQIKRNADVHCVTGWSVLGARWTGVQVARLAKMAGVRASARHVIFEGAHGYTANVRIDEALAPGVLVAHRLEDRPLALTHGAPVRAVVPDLYFWKSAKWLTGIRFVKKDEPGYWETRGYNNHADPWKEERYSF